MSFEKPDATGLRAGLTSYGDEEFSLFLRKAFIKGAGYTDDALDRKVIGIVDTGISIHESFANPTSMYLRNLMSMDVEEMIRAQPMDAVILIGGCDKTVPAELMGAISADVPFIQLVVGPMIAGSHKGVRVGACTDCRGYWGKYRAGIIDIEEIGKVGNELVPGVGTCGVMGTASTMACITEAMGLMPMGSATPPAVTSARFRYAEETGRLSVLKGIKPSDILTRESFENAITVLMALGGSTNAIVHLLAIAGRVEGLGLTLDDFNRIGRNVPLLVDLKPTGDNYMEDFHKAGGVPVLLRQLKPLLHLEALTITGRTLGEEIDAYPPDFPQHIVRGFSNPIFPSAALAILKGNLSPNGCVIKQAAMSMDLRKFSGKAVVFTSSQDMADRIDSDDLEVTKDSVLVLQNAGPKGHPGMPEGGYIPIPKKLARQGVKDLVRISDARMSGTAFGAVILHVSPEAAVGGPLAVVQNGDEIRLDVDSRMLELVISEEEMKMRLTAWKSKDIEARKTRGKGRGYNRLYKESVLQAHQGADFDFLVAEPEVQTSI